MEKAVYEFSKYFGRMGDINGVLVLDKKKAEWLQGKRVYFGEILGKHSEIIVDSLKLEELSDNEEVVAFCERFGPFGNYLPIDSIVEDYYFELIDDGKSEEEASAMVKDLWE